MNHKKYIEMVKLNANDNARNLVNKLEFISLAKEQGLNLRFKNGNNSSIIKKTKK